MNMDQLHALVLIHRLGSINKASAQMHLSQQALNASMKKLESEVGHELLLRHPRGVSLSENGLILEHFAEDMLAKYSETLLQMKAAPTETTCAKEKLQVFFSPAIGNSYLANITKMFSASHPATQLTLMEKEGDEIKSLILEEHTPALGLVADFQFALQHEHCTVIPIFYDKLYAIISKTHPLVKQKSATLRTIIKYPLALYQSSHTVTNNVCKLLEKVGTPNYLITTNRMDLFQSAILYQNALGFVNKSTFTHSDAMHDVIADIVALPIRNVPPLLFLAIVNNDYLAAHEASIRDLLQIYRSLF